MICGGALAGPVVGYMAIRFGWRWAFVAIMLLGLVWLVVWTLTTTEQPQQDKRVKPEELALIVAGQQQASSMEHAPEGEKVGLRYYLKQPIILATAFALHAQQQCEQLTSAALPAFRAYDDRR